MIWDIEIHYRILMTEFDANEAQNILTVANSIPADGYWNEETLMYFMAWFYALTTKTNEPESAAKRNRGCVYCVQKTKIFMTALIEKIRHEQRSE